MTLRGRLERLERAGVKPARLPSVIIREIIQPCAAGPELVALSLRTLHDGRVVQIARNPGEGETALRERLAAIGAA